MHISQEVHEREAGCDEGLRKCKKKHAFGTMSPADRPALDFASTVVPGTQGLRRIDLAGKRYTGGRRAPALALLFALPRRASAHGRRLSIDV